jgi:hypothetical protein
MRKASTGMPEQGTRAPSPAPDLIPAKIESTENLHRDWTSERGHINPTNIGWYSSEHRAHALLHVLTRPEQYPHYLSRNH